MMTRSIRAFFTLFTVAWLAACGSPGTPDNGSPDVGSLDAGSADVALDGSVDARPGSGDASADTGDDSSADLDGLGEGFGAISGTCGVLDTELTSPEPHLFRNAIDFGDDPYDDTDASRLTDGGREILADGNENETSILSEVFAYEVLARCEDAALVKTETEIDYEPMSKKTDLLVEIDGEKIGVSVTRAVGFPRDDPYTVEQATTLLQGKLGDILLSSEGVRDADRWTKQILHVIAYAPGHADSIDAAYQGLDADVRADTVVWVTVSNGADEFLY